MSGQADNRPFISVIMPVRNVADYIGQAIESILDQTYTHFELIIIDDASTDRTWEIVCDFAEQDQRIRAIRQDTHQGVSYTLNKGLDEAKGSYVARMDGDDFCDRERFEKQLRLLEKTGGDICSTYQVYINEAGAELYKRKFDVNRIGRIIILETPISHATVLMKKALFDQYGKYKEEYIGCEDYELWLRLWHHGCHFVVCEEYLYYCRLHSSTVKSLNTKQTIRNILKVKRYARKVWKIQFGVKGHLRMMAEAFLLLLPSPLILFLFKKVGSKKS